MANKGPTIYNDGEPLFEPTPGEWTELDISSMIQIPLFIKICFWCPLLVFKCCLPKPKVRGIPVGSAPLSKYEKEQLCQRLAGNWKIQPLQGLPSGSVEYTDAMIRNDSIIMTGGMHNAMHDGQSYGVANTAQEQKIIPFRAPNGTLFVDNIGSILVRESIDGGEIEIDNAMGMKVLFQREWKRAGYPAPSGESGPVQATLSDSPFSQRMEGRIDDINITPTTDKIRELKKLADEGVLTDSEFQEAKNRVLMQL